MSFVILSLFFYYRIFRKRVEYSLEILKLNLTPEYLILCSFLFFIHIFIICFISIQLRVKKKESSKILFYMKKINEILVYKPLDYVVTKISPYIPYSGTLIINYCYFFRKNTFRLFLAKVLCFIFYFLPKIFMALILDICCYNFF